MRAVTVWAAEDQTDHFQGGLRWFDQIVKNLAREGVDRNKIAMVFIGPVSLSVLNKHAFGHIDFFGPNAKDNLAEHNRMVSQIYSEVRSCRAVPRGYAIFIVED